jgi:all-trans-retinol 13,14-reductase
LYAGGYVPVGGASSIAAAMMPIIEAAGGAVVTSAGVQQLLLQNGKAAGVRLEDGQEISSDVVSSICEQLCMHYVLLPAITIA